MKYWRFYTTTLWICLVAFSAYYLIIDRQTAWVAPVMYIFLLIVDWVWYRSRKREELRKELTDANARDDDM